MIAQPAEAAGIDVESDDASRLVEESFRDHPADSSAGAGDHDNFVTQIENHAVVEKVVVSSAAESPPTQTSKVEASLTKSLAAALQ